jgi:hypothetical protein
MLACATETSFGRSRAVTTGIQVAICRVHLLVKNGTLGCSTITSLGPLSGQSLRQCGFGEGTKSVSHDRLAAGA